MAHCPAKGFARRKRKRMVNFNPGSQINRDVKFICLEDGKKDLEMLPSFSLLRDLRNQFSLKIDFCQS